MTRSQDIAFFSFPVYKGANGSGRSPVIEGLKAEASWVSPKYLYDPLGSRLFDAITELPEYYPTRTERSLLESCRDQIARAAPTEPTLIDLGAGNCEKASSLFMSLKPRQYVAVDISVEFLRQSMAKLRRDFPHIEMVGVGMDFSTGLQLPDAVRRESRLFFYPGSSIGNFSPEQALNFLSRVRAHCADGGLLIGVDLIKPASILQPAYDDALGVTAAFNLNVLNNLNALIGSDFVVGDWRHRAVFNAALSRIEMHLEARRDITVTWPGGTRHFARGERIHTENSYKYALEDFKTLMQRAGFRELRAWTDERDWFALCLAIA